MPLRSSCSQNTLGIGRFREGAVFVGEISFAAVELELAVGAEGDHFLGSYCHLEDAGVEIADVDAVTLVVLGGQAQGVGFDPEVDVFGDEDGGDLGRTAVDAQGQGNNAAVGAIDAGTGVLAIAELGLGLVEDEGLSVAAYIERFLNADQAAEEELESLALEGLKSGDPIQAGPGYWEEKHRRLDERLKKTGTR